MNEDTLIFLYDGDNRGWKTALQCALELGTSGLWAPALSEEDVQAIESSLSEKCDPEDSWAGQEVAEEWIRSARLEKDGHTYDLYQDGSIWAVRDDHRCGDEGPLSEPDNFEDPPEGYVVMTLPSSWASYLVNGDSSGMEDELSDPEHPLTLKEIDDLVEGEVVDCREHGFVKYHDAYCLQPLAGDCHQYLIDMRRISDVEYGKEWFLDNCKVSVQEIMNLLWINQSSTWMKQEDRPLFHQAFTPHPSTGIHNRLDLILQFIKDGSEDVDAILYDAEKGEITWEKRIPRKDFWGIEFNQFCPGGYLREIPSCAWAHLPKVSDILKSEGAFSK